MLRKMSEFTYEWEERGNADELVMFPQENRNERKTNFPLYFKSQEITYCREKETQRKYRPQPAEWGEKEL